MQMTNYTESGAGGGEFYAMVRRGSRQKSPTKNANFKLGQMLDPSLSMRSASGMAMANNMQGNQSIDEDQFTHCDAIQEDFNTLVVL